MRGYLEIRLMASQQCFLGPEQLPLSDRRDMEAAENVY